MRTQQALFPAMLAAITAVVFITGLISNINVVEASTSEPSITPVGEKSDAVIKESQAAESKAGNCSLPGRYPENVRRWCDLIQENAANFGLEARFIAAVMLQESGGNPKAYSKSGAVGLMQIMPRDGLAAKFTCNGRPCFSARPSMDELYDPAFNIAYGARMLSGLISRTGNPREALKSYGPMDVGYYYADLVLRIYENYR